MKAFANALCAVDGTPESLAAVGKAAELVGPDGHLTLLVVTSFPHLPEIHFPAILPGRASEIIEQALHITESAGVSASVDVDPAGPPAKVILEWSADRDLLAMGAPTTSWFGAMLKGEAVAEAEASLSTPLLVYHLRPGAASPPRILVASDGGDESDGLVELAGELVDAQGADVTLLHVLGAASHADRHRIQRQAKELALLAGGNCDLRIEVGDARSLVVETAHEVAASLIVMSSRRLHGLRTVGSVSRRVVHHADCPVLLLPPEHLLTNRIRDRSGVEDAPTGWIGPPRSPSGRRNRHGGGRRAAGARQHRDGRARPPGIPVIMPGERFPDAESALIRYLTTSERLAQRFPSFETEIHGIAIQQDRSYRVPCLGL